MLVFFGYESYFNSQYLKYWDFWIKIYWKLLKKVDSKKYSRCIKSNNYILSSKCRECFGFNIGTENVFKNSWNLNKGWTYSYKNETGNIRGGKQR